MAKDLQQVPPNCLPNRVAIFESNFPSIRNRGRSRCTVCEAIHSAVASSNGAIGFQAGPIGSSSRPQESFSNRRGIATSRSAPASLPIGRRSPESRHVRAPATAHFLGTHLLTMVGLDHWEQGRSRVAVLPSHEPCRLPAPLWGAWGKTAPPPRALPGAKLRWPSRPKQIRPGYLRTGNHGVNS